MTKKIAFIGKRIKTRFEVRAKKIARDTSIGIINSEIEDWAKDCNEILIKIEGLKRDLEDSNSKRLLWVRAKKIKLHLPIKKSR